MPTAPSNEQELRIRLEGRVEQVEALIRRSRAVSDALERSSWQSEVVALEAVPTDDEKQALMKVTASDAGRPFIVELRASRTLANHLAAKRLRELGVPVTNPAEAVAELRSHLPIQFHARGVSQVVWSGTSATFDPDRKTMMRALALFLTGMGVLCMFWRWDVGSAAMVMLFATMFGMFFFVAKRSLTITQRVVATDGRAVPLDEVLLVAVKHYVTGKERSGTSRLEFTCKRGKPLSIKFQANTKPITRVLTANGIAFTEEEIVVKDSSSSISSD